jgi:hypothetical protein
MKIESGQITYPYEFGEFCKTNQYYRIIGSVFNDGVHRHGSEELTDEEWEGAIWLMAVPKEVEMLSIEIGMWQEKYGGVSSENMSPYQSESFGGYSYSKASGGNSKDSASSVPTWQGVYADSLRRYKKI